MSPRTLLTFGPMIDSELCRLLLARYDLSYREERHLFGWVSILALARVGTLQVPVLLGDDKASVGPRALTERYDPDAPEGRRLLPVREPMRTHVWEDWQRFNGELAADTAGIAYFYLLPNKEALIEPFSRGVPASEAKLTRPLYPLLRGLFVLLLRLKPQRIGDALIRTRACVDRVDARLADGRTFLHGQAMSLADLALVSAIAPLIVPQGYMAPVPDITDMPSELAMLINEMRARPVAALVDRVYKAITSPAESAPVTVNSV